MTKVIFTLFLIAAALITVKPQSDKPKQITWDGGGIGTAQSLTTKRIFIGGNDSLSAGLNIFNDLNFNLRLSFGHELTISDSTGILATRDSCGNWIIKDAGRALEAIYILLLKDKHF